jgi:predicted component of type VI protein secretion system
VSQHKGRLAYFLVSPHFKTIRLLLNQPLTVGREKYNDLVLNDLLVSRQHSVIQFEKDHFIVRDLNSRNGTFLNNSRVDKSDLQDGDIIKIGGFEFTFRISSPLDIEKFLMREGVRRSSQETLIEADFGLRFSEKGFSGDFTTLSLIEVVQTLFQGLKTGILTIGPSENETNPAKLYFENGEIVHASCNTERGFPAILSVMQIAEGQFEFQNDVPSPEKTVQQPMMAILLEASRQIDEKHRESTNC